MLFLLLIISTFSTPVQQSEHNQKLRPIPSEVIELVVKRELSSGGPSMQGPVCLTVNASDPKKKVIETLLKQGINVRKGSICVREMRGRVLILAGLQAPPRPRGGRQTRRYGCFSGGLGNTVERIPIHIQKERSWTVGATYSHKALL